MTNVAARLRSSKELKTHLPSVLLLLGTIGISLAQPLDSDGDVRGLGIDPAWLVWLSLAPLVVGQLAVIVGSARRTNLERELATRELELRRARRALDRLGNRELTLLSKKLHYASSERITLFVRASDGLYSVARYSDHPQFRLQAVARWPWDEGCVGRAWADEFAEAHDLPDPTADFEGWKTRNCEDWNIAPDRVAAMRFRARTCIAIRVSSAFANAQPLGVIVFESRKIRAEAGTAVLDAAVIRETLDGLEDVALRMLLEAFAALLEDA